jgi:uncharacterized protein (DUF1330 family)
MNTNHKLAQALLTGVSIGAAGVSAVHAYQVKTPPAYLIAEVEVINPAALENYAGKVRQTLAPFAGHYHFLVRGGATQTLEGAAPTRIAVIAFDSVANARAWYDSPAYAAIRPIRQNAAKSRVFIVEGIVPQ